jgi:hypothetical protein
MNLVQCIDVLESIIFKYLYSTNQQVRVHNSIPPNVFLDAAASLGIEFQYL